MLLILTDKLTNRLDYTLSTIFGRILGIQFRITTNKDEFISHIGAKLSYGNSKICNEIFIKSTELVFSSGIKNQNLQPNLEGRDFYFFPVNSSGSDFHFDIFAASFYLISRYEEYLPHNEDIHNRFCIENSLAFQYKCLKKPLINLWALELEKKIRNKYPDLSIPEKRFTFIPTFDIDNAYACKHRSFFRLILKFGNLLVRGEFKKLSDQIKILRGKMKDPYDTYDYLIQNIKKYQLDAVFFILFAKRGKYDRGLFCGNKHFQKLIQYLHSYVKIGIHPSYASFNNKKLLKNEIRSLGDILEEKIRDSRFHFIRFCLPDSYWELIDNNILHDYSMGYASECGFRASICTPFYFYDLANDCETNLLVHPFAIMDGTLNYYLKIPVEKAFSIFKEIIDEVKVVEGTFYCIWHNESLSGCAQWKGWENIYEQVVEYANQKRED